MELLTAYQTTAPIGELAQIYQFAAAVARTMPDECRELISLANERGALELEIVEHSTDRRIVARFSVEEPDGTVAAGELCSFECPKLVQPGLRLETFRRSLIRNC